VPTKDPYFQHFKTSVSGIKQPSAFTYPFNYTPHPLSRVASIELQQYIASHDEWLFESNPQNKEHTHGKMFGVLVVKDQENRLGYLVAYSGNDKPKRQDKTFVPPVYDYSAEDGFFKQENAKIISINDKVNELIASEEYLKLKQELVEVEETATEVIHYERKKIKENKSKRNELRYLLKSKVFEDEYEMLQERLKHESYLESTLLKYKKREQNALLSAVSAKINSYEEEINALKKERKQRSIDLQHKLFEQYTFLNGKGDTKSLLDIFNKALGEDPPSGAGECAAPKLLHYAFAHDYTPVCMAEFWWGESSPKEVRKQGNFYASCRSRCKPILTHMLEGLNVEDHPNDFKDFKSKELEVLYSDEHLVVISKPHDLLSVPGKEIKECVQSKVKEMYPNATGPMMVHRLDMATSGVMVVAKNEHAYHVLQLQFINRTIKKRYAALLDGLLVDREGTIELPLRVDLDDRPRQLVCEEHGRHAKTTWKEIERRAKHTLVHFFPVTGRTHQLRVHAAHSLGLDTPIVGDELYGQRGKRMYLHAEFLAFEHPISGELMRFEVKADF